MASVRVQSPLAVADSSLPQHGLSIQTDNGIDPNNNTTMFTLFPGPTPTVIIERSEIETDDEEEAIEYIQQSGALPTTPKATDVVTEDQKVETDSGRRDIQIVQQQGSSKRKRTSYSNNNNSYNERRRRRSNTMSPTAASFSSSSSSSSSSSYMSAAFHEEICLQLRRDSTDERPVLEERLPMLVLSDTESDSDSE